MSSFSFLFDDISFLYKKGRNKRLVMYQISSAFLPLALPSSPIISPISPKQKKKKLGELYDAVLLRRDLVIRVCPFIHPHPEEAQKRERELHTYRDDELILSIDIIRFRLYIDPVCSCL